MPARDLLGTRCPKPALTIVLPRICSSARRVQRPGIVIAPSHPFLPSVLTGRAGLSAMNRCGWSWCPYQRSTPKFFNIAAVWMARFIVISSGGVPVQPETVCMWSTGSGVGSACSALGDVTASGQPQSNRCIAQPLGRMVSKEPELSDCKRHPT